MNWPATIKDPCGREFQLVRPARSVGDQTEPAVYVDAAGEEWTPSVDFVLALNWEQPLPKPVMFRYSRTVLLFAVLLLGLAGCAIGPHGLTFPWSPKLPPEATSSATVTNQPSGGHRPPLQNFPHE